MKYDITAIAFSHPRTDARLLNIVNTLRSAGKKILVIGIMDESFIPYANESEIDYKGIISDTSQRLLKRWSDFIKQGNRFLSEIESAYILASDLYALPVGANLKKQSGGKLFYDSREIYSALGSLSKFPFKQKFQNMIEKYYVSFVDEMLVSGDMDAEYLSKYFAHNLTYHTIMNLPPFNKAERTNFLREKFSLSENTRIILYQGALMEGRGIEQLIGAIKLVPNSVLCILGAGPKENYFKKLVIEQNLESNVLFCGAVPYDELAPITAEVDLGAALFQPVSLSYQLALPNKLFEYFMAGVPVIASDLPAIRKIYDEFNFGSLVKSDITNQNLADEISALLDKREKFHEVLQSATKKYNYNNQAEKILNIFGI